MDISEYETTTETVSKENAFPDLTAVGRAFAGAITYINAQDHADLQTEARSWLISYACNTMRWLRSELEMLRVNRSSPTRLPRYAFDPNFEMIFFSENVSYKLLAFAGQFVGYMAQLLKACGLDAKVSFNGVASYNPPIRIGIRFP